MPPRSIIIDRPYDAAVFALVSRNAKIANRHESIYDNNACRIS